MRSLTYSVAVLFLSIFSITPNVSAKEPAPNPPVYRIPDINLGCQPGQRPDCRCDYFQCNGMLGTSPNGVNLCGDVNGDEKQTVQDCIEAVREICKIAGYTGNTNYSCYDNSALPDIFGFQSGIYEGGL